MYDKIVDLSELQWVDVIIYCLCFGIVGICYWVSSNVVQF